MRLHLSAVWAAFLLALAILALAFGGSAARADWLGNAVNAKACQKGGWQLLQTSAGQPFASADECTSYGAHGGVSTKPPIS